MRHLYLKETFIKTNLKLKPIPFWLISRAARWLKWCSQNPIQMWNLMTCCSPDPYMLISSCWIYQSQIHSFKVMLIISIFCLSSFLLCIFLLFKSVSMRKLAGGNTAKTTNFTQTWHKCWVWWTNDGGKKCRSKYFIASMLGDPLFDTDLCSLILTSLV